MDGKSVFWQGFCSVLPCLDLCSLSEQEEGWTQGFGKDGEHSFSRNPDVLIASFALVLGMTLISQNISEKGFIRCGKAWRGKLKGCR